MKRSVSRSDWWALVLGLSFPTISTLIYFVVLAKWMPTLALVTYVPLKLVQFGFPLYWVYVARRERPFERGKPEYLTSVLMGLAFGVIVLVAGLAIYHFWLLPSGLFAGEVGEKIDRKVAGFQLATPAAFLACAAFYALVHSFLEEFYWRWFVFRQCREAFWLPAAIAVSSLGFMAHHILVLGEYFGFRSPVTFLLSLAIAIGGAFWAWLYDRCNTLLGPWLSHLLIDAAIFAIGYDLMFRPA
jgi:membrane protease YdiL (CAAX protease family)